jgi:predicted RNA-binding protein
VKMMSYWKCTMSDMKNFHSSAIVFNVILKMKTERKQLLNKLQQNTRIHQIKETNEDNTTKHEQVTNHNARKFIV